jgi:uncharacterized membrane protein
MSDLFRNEERDRAEREYEERIQRSNMVNLKAFAFTVAIVIAPFLALLLSVELALGVLAAGLLFSTWLTWQGAKQVGPAHGTQLRTAAILNFGVFLLVVMVLALMLVA